MPLKDINKLPTKKKGLYHERPFEIELFLKPYFLIITVFLGRAILARIFSLDNNSRILTL